MKKVWFVTGCSKGLGRQLVRELLEQGYCVGACSRNRDSLIRIFGNESDTFLPLEVNPADENSVKAAVEKTCEYFGRIDCAVNNAGYTHLGVLEEFSDQEARALFDVNVIGVLNVIRHVLPLMRRQKQGHIFNISSLGAYNTGPLAGIYCASKHAVLAISETLAMETEGMGIHVTDVEPGFMRTDFLNTSRQNTYSETDEYQALIRDTMEFYDGQDGKQSGNPAISAKQIIAEAERENPRLHLPLGADSYDGILAVLKQMKEEIETIDRNSAVTEFDRK